MKKLRTVSLTILTASVLSSWSLEAGAATSTFDLGNDGWIVQDINGGTFVRQGTHTPNWTSTGGNPGGHISIDDPSGFFSNYSAPASFLGDQSALIGSNLGFDLRNEAGNATSGALVTLRGGPGDQILAYSAFVPVSSGSFTTWSIALSPDDAGWMHYDDGFLNGTDADLADFQAVLGSLTDLYIAAEFSATSPNDMSWLDNVVLPEASTLSMFIIASLCFLTWKTHRL